MSKAFKLRHSIIGVTLILFIPPLGTLQAGKQDKPRGVPMWKEARVTLWFDHTIRLNDPPHASSNSTAKNMKMSAAGRRITNLRNCRMTGGFLRAIPKL